ncbi:MAG: hypothetical protein Q8K59_01945, partial [Nitrosomonas sp.]|nr:hypothetical protein [Nitrosomonas sp.]MDP1949858.1 hypothetical protein [Nitrosomonas sp.]
MNLSRGFNVTSIFGIDYKYQQQCTTHIPELLCAGIRKGLLNETYGSSLQDIFVFFEHANTSSFDFKVIATFDGKVAGDYFSITRALQRYAVEVCNQRQWETLFAQLVIHKGTSKNPYLRAAALRLACLPRFVTILRCSQKIFPYLSIICCVNIFYSR